MLTVSRSNTQGTHSFWAHDSHERYLANLATERPDWYYRKHTVTYKINSEGYRCPEFDQINWPNTIVILGDELAWGQGLDESDTLARKLSIHLERPTITLAQPAASAEFTWAQSLELHSLNPHMIICLWPDPLRWTNWAHDTPTHQGHWTPCPPPERERITRAQRCSRATQQLYPNSLHWTIDNKWAWLYNANTVDPRTVNLDRSRDGSIIGRQATDLLARHIALEAAKR